MSHKRSCKGNSLIGKIKNIGQRKVQQRGIKRHKLEMIIFCYEYNSDWYIETYMDMKQVPTLCLSQANVIGNEDTRIIHVQQIWINYPTCIRLSRGEAWL